MLHGLRPSPDSSSYWGAFGSPLSYSQENDDLLGIDALEPRDDVIYNKPSPKPCSPIGMLYSERYDKESPPPHIDTLFRPSYQSAEFHRSLNPMPSASPSMGPSLLSPRKVETDEEEQQFELEISDGTSLETFDYDFVSSFSSLGGTPPNVSNGMNSSLAFSPPLQSELAERGNSAYNSGEHPYGEYPSRTLFVRNIHSSVDDEELRALFGMCGSTVLPIRSMYTQCKHRGFVMISYYDLRDAKTAMQHLQNKVIRGRKLDIHYSIPKDNPSEKDQNQGTLVVFNLDPSTTDDELMTIFGVHGEIKEIRATPNKKHHKFIEFYDVRHAEKAMKCLNKTDIKGKKIKIEPSRPGGGVRKASVHHHQLGGQPISSSATQTALPSLGQPHQSQQFVQTPLPFELAETDTDLADDQLHLGMAALNLGVAAFSPANNFLTEEPPTTDSAIQPSAGNSWMYTYASPPLSLPYPQHPISLPEPSSASQQSVNSSAPSPVPVPSREPTLTSNVSVSSSLSPSSSPSTYQDQELTSSPAFLEYSTARFYASAPPPYQMHRFVPHLWRASPPVTTVHNSFSENRGVHMGYPSSNPVAVPSIGSTSGGSGMGIGVNIGVGVSAGAGVGSGGAGIAIGASANNATSSASPGTGSSPAVILSPKAAVGLTSRPSRGTTYPPIKKSTTSSAVSMPPYRNQEAASNGPVGAGPGLSVGAGAGAIGGVPVAVGTSMNVGVSGTAVGTVGVAGKSQRGRHRSDSVDEKSQFSLSIDRVKAGREQRTTLMIKNIPNKYSQKMLLAAVDEHHKGRYDFFYLPIDFKNKCNVGYAFINFIDTLSIPAFYTEFNGKKWEKFNSEKVCAITFARIQGKASLIAHFQNSSLMCEDRKCRPIIFHSDGPHVGEQEPFPVGSNVRMRRKDERIGARDSKLPLSSHISSKPREDNNKKS